MNPSPETPKITLRSWPFNQVKLDFNFWIIIAELFPQVSGISFGIEEPKTTSALRTNILDLGEASLQFCAALGSLLA